MGATLTKREKSWRPMGKSQPSFESDELNMDEHLISVDQLCQRFRTDSIMGLPKEEANVRRKRDGKNELSEPAKKSEIIKFLEIFLSGFGILLITGGLVSIGSWILNNLRREDVSNDNLWLGIALLAVALVTAFLQYYQEFKTSKIMESFKHMIPEYACVKRAGVRCSVPTKELVVGDLVELKGGDKVPADIRIIESHSFKVDNSIITGESEPQVRRAENSNKNPWEATNIVFSSTHATDGTAIGIVLRTGDRTLIGAIANITSSLNCERAPIALELERFIEIISLVAFFWGSVTLFFCVVNGYPMIDSLLYFISTVIANVPEGLLATVTVLLALTAKRMATKNCLVRRLEAIETLGSTNVICTDKTGTLTQNRMTVAHYWLNESVVEADTSPEQSEMINHLQLDADTKRMLRMIVLCNKAEFKDDTEGVPVLKRECVGDASDAALLKYAEILSGQTKAIRSKYKKLCEVPFNSTDKMHISVHQSEHCNFVLMKGAPERILANCKSFLQNGDEHAITPDYEARFSKVYLQLGGLGERVLGLCQLKLPVDDYPIGYYFDNEKLNFPTSRMQFVGLISLVDPPRPGTHDAVDKCKRAQIKVTMVTGDHPITAIAIAKSVGIVGPDSETMEEIAWRKGIGLDQVNPREATACVVHGAELRDMTAEQLSHIISGYNEIIFARTSPQQKLLIVETYQRLGYTVAVTGDGVNDSPALKKANIGIAMGITGCDVSKQAADIILMDDNFASIVTGVEEGRLIFDNMKKAISYVLTSNIPELFPFILHIFLNIPLALGTAAILCIDLGTDIWPDISLAYESPEGDLMTRKARDRNKDHLINARMISYSYGQIGIIQAAGAFMTYLIVMNDNGFKPQQLVGIRSAWVDQSNNNLLDSYGQEWTFGQRKILEHTCHTAFFASIVVMQWANLICSKTRRNSIINQGMSNRWLNFGLLFETALAALLVYCPGMDKALCLQPIKFEWWWPSVPFAVLIFVYDEFRKLILRCERHFWFKKEMSF